MSGNAAPCTIRRLLPADAEVYRDLRLRGLREHPEAFTSSAEEEAHKPLSWSADRLRADAARPHDLFLGAFLPRVTGDAVLVGVVGLVGRYRPKERHTATLVGMYVAPEAAGQGVGRALVQALLQAARALPELQRVDLTVTEGNGAAEALYLRCGFTRWGRMPDAIRVDGRSYAKLHLQMDLRAPTGPA